MNIFGWPTVTKASKIDCFIVGGKRASTIQPLIKRKYVSSNVPQQNGSNVLQSTNLFDLRAHFPLCTHCSVHGRSSSTLCLPPPSLSLRVCTNSFCLALSVHTKLHILHQSSIVQSNIKLNTLHIDLSCNFKLSFIKANDCLTFFTLSFVGSPVLRKYAKLALLLVGVRVCVWVGVSMNAIRIVLNKWIHTMINQNININLFFLSPYTETITYKILFQMILHNQ